MSKKDYKRKKSKSLTRQKKIEADPETQKTTNAINHQSTFTNTTKKRPSH